MNELGQYFEKYLALRKAQNISKNTLELERMSHKKLWIFLKDHYPEFKSELFITTEQLQKYSRYINKLETIRQNTKLNYLKNLTQFFIVAVRQEWILLNPMLEIEMPKRYETVPRILTVKEMKSLLEAPPLNTAKGIRDRAVLELMYSCGLRRDELINLREENFQENYRLLRLKGKGSKEAVLPVGKVAGHFCKFYAEELRPTFDKGKGNLEFFLSMQHRPFYIKGLRQIIQDYLPLTDIKTVVSPHVFRYSIASHLAEEGVDIRLIQAFLRHDDLDTTAKYIKLSYQKLQEVHNETHPREQS